MKSTLKSAFLAFFVCALVSAQTTVSQISGFVRDATGAAIAAASINVTNTDTGASRTVESTENGSYLVTNLVSGPYKLSVTKSGFTTFNQTGIVLQVNTNPEVSVTLQVGSMSESVSVEANAAMVETVSNAVGQVIDQQRVVDLPLNGRNVTQLITLSGAAVPATGGGLATNLNYPGAAAFAIAGGQGNATNYFLDGGTHIDPRTNVGLPLPFPDALQEFKVETSTLPANYGNHPGGAVNVVTKSGANATHGDAFEFLRNYAFNARNFFAPARDTLKRNQFGGVVGGAIKKDKLFYFAGFQGTREGTAPITTQSFVPTPAVLRGDFTTMLSSACQRTPITLSAASGAVNNVIPQSLLNPVALKYAALLPTTNDPCGRVLYGVPSNTREYQGVTRIDYQRTSSDLLFVRYFITDYSLAAFYDKSNLLTAGTAGLRNRVQAGTIGDTHIIGARMVNSFRASFSRSAINRVGADGIPTMAELGSQVYSPIPNYTGQVSVTGYFSSGAIPGYVFTNTYTLTNDFGMTLNGHQITIGGNWIHPQMNSLGPFQQNPRMTFNATGGTNSALGDFMTGRIGTFLQGGGQVGRDRANIPSLYAQDNFKVSPRFQLNIGVRWDPFLPQQSKYGYSARFNVPDFYAGKTSKVYVNAPPGMTFPGDDGYPNAAPTLPRYMNFAPRFGFVADPRGKGKETIRGGYGFFYDTSYLWYTMQIPLNAPWGQSITLQNVGLTNPWANYPGGNPFPTPTPGRNVAFPNTGVYKFQPSNANATYVQQWNLSFQKQLGADWLLSATYLGNKTTHQWLGRELNPSVPIAGATVGNTEARRTFTLANPNTGRLLSSTIMTDDGGNASYNGLLLSANHRFSRSYSVLANYTWSHCLNQGEANQDIANLYQNPNNRRAEWGNCSSDRRQIFNLSGVAQTPKFSSRMMQRLLGDWQLSSIFTKSTGPVLNITTGADISLTGVNADRPLVVGDPNTGTRSISSWFNTAAFVRQPAGTLGNAGRNILRGPGVWNFDTALSRNFTVREGVRLNFRWEVFNLFNHARFNNPGGSLNAGTTYGVITTAQDPRIMQLAAKIVF